MNNTVYVSLLPLVLWGLVIFKCYYWSWDVKDKNIPSVLYWCKIVPSFCYGIIFSCSYSRNNSLAHAQRIISEAAMMPGGSAPLLCFQLLCCRVFKVLQKVRVRLNSMDCIRSDYTAQTQSLVVKKKNPQGNWGWAQGHFNLSIDFGV